MEYWIWLSSVPYIGPVTSRRLVQAFGDPETVYRSDASDLCQIKGITQRQIVSLRPNSRCQTQLNFYKQTNPYLQIMKTVLYCWKVVSLPCKGNRNSTPIGRRYN